MGEARQVLEIIDSAISDGVRRGIAMLTAEDAQLDGRTVRIGGRAKLNFASCSYLGLELDPRVQEGAIDAVRRYGTQFSSSRTYLSAPLYAELEELLDRITGGFCVVAPNTTLGHLSALPVLVSEDDAVILDHQVHHTVQLAVPQLRQQGSHVEFLRHGRVDQLEERVRALRSSHARIWYLADGIYSMVGDRAPLDALRWLQTRYEQLHLYVDDAHGMSWCGRHGRGFALERLGASRERVVVAVSLNKAFGAAGGALVLPDPELRRRIRTCGGPMIFTGPIQPPLLGAAVASARIHLSEEFEGFQAELRDRIRFANRRARELDLPLVGRAEVPIRFIGLGLPRVANAMVEQLLEQGFLTNSAVFPAVPIQRGGVRFTLTRHQTREDIGRLLEAMDKELPRTLAREGLSREDVDRAFRRVRPGAALRPRPRSARLHCSHETTIRALDAAEWERCLGGQGSFGWQGLAHLERVFAQAPEPENRWSFHYYVVRDAEGRPILATFFSEALWKDDIVADAAVSRVVEQARARDPYFLTSRVFGMGSLVTEGNHLHLEREGPWREALALLLERVGRDAEACGADRIVLRDLPDDDPELEAALREEGFTPLAAPASLVLELDWRDWDELLERLSYRARRFQRRSVLPQQHAFETEVLRCGGRAPSESEWALLYRLYRNVEERSLELNTFPLPEAFLRRMLDHSCWEILTLRLRAECGAEPGAGPAAFVAAYVGPEQYVPVLVGLDYRVVESHGAYRQCIRQVIERGRAHGARRVLFGMGAELEKARFGARAVRRRLYVQSQDHFQHDVLALLGTAPETPDEPAQA